MRWLSKDNIHGLMYLPPTPPDDIAQLELGRHIPLGNRYLLVYGL